MSTPIQGADCVRFASILVRRPSQILYTKNHVPVQFEVSGEQSSTASHEICPFATRARLDLEGLLFNAGPAITDVIDLNMDITQSVVVVGRIFVIKATF